MPDEMQVVSLEDNFYRDGFGKVLFVFISLLTAIVFIVSLSIYLRMTKPAPVQFNTDVDFRVQAPVPIDQAYLAIPDLLQWVSDVLPKVFTFNFYEYDKQLESYKHYFTDQGFEIFSNQLNNYANYNNVKNGKVFVSASPDSAPTVVNQGVLSGRYAWWVEMPLTITYAGMANPPDKNLTFQVLVVRVPTLNNLSGVVIDNIIVTKGATD